MIDFTPLVRPRMVRQARRMDVWADNAPRVQARTLRELLATARNTLIGRKYRFDSMLSLTDDELKQAYTRELPVVEYEDIRHLAERTLKGEKDLLWPGRCRSFAQSSGTSGGKSKYIPITPYSLKHNHIAGASDAVASYLRLNPRSRLFSGKALILGGSFANELGDAVPPGVRVGDLSATLIASTPPLADLFRIPSRKTALMADWEEKLPAIIHAARRARVTNLSGVPSWFLILLRRLMHTAGVDNLHRVWPSLEVFFHGGISFRPYRDQYLSFTDPEKMHFLETYNASEGFFAVQTDFARHDMQLLLDRGVYYEFAPLLPDGTTGEPVPLEQTVTGKTYALVITSCNGLWRYSIGDTVRLTRPEGGIVIAGRTKSYINAFGEELMEHNADTAISNACARLGASIANYTAAPLYAQDGRKGCHRWLIEWNGTPPDPAAFAHVLDDELQKTNSDYQAKRSGNIFLDPPQVIAAPPGLFDKWLAANGTGKLGGQRKVPRLCPTPSILDSMLALTH